MWFRHRRREVTLYGKPGCHLCEQARDLVGKLARRYPLDLCEIDIRSDPELYRQYDLRIPVVVIDGSIVLEAPITEAVLRRALR